LKGPLWVETPEIPLTRGIAFFPKAGRPAKGVTKWRLERCQAPDRTMATSARRPVARSARSAAPFASQRPHYDSFVDRLVETWLSILINLILKTVRSLLLSATRASSPGTSRIAIGRDSQCFAGYVATTERRHVQPSGRQHAAARFCPWRPVYVSMPSRVTFIQIVEF
jgi:hypothetical protein